MKANPSPRTRRETPAPLHIVTLAATSTAQISEMAMKECERAIFSVHVCVLMLDGRAVLRYDRPFQKREMQLAGKVREFAGRILC